MCEISVVITLSHNRPPVSNTHLRHVTVIIIPLLQKDHESKLNNMSSIEINNLTSIDRFRNLIIIIYGCFFLEMY